METCVAVAVAAAAVVVVVVAAKPAVVAVVVGVVVALPRQVLDAVLVQLVLGGVQRHAELLGVASRLEQLDV